MTVGVVDLLEAIEIEHQHRYTRALRQGLLQRLIEMFGKGAAVRQSGQWIMPGQFEGLGFRCAASLDLGLELAIPAVPENDKRKNQRHGDVKQFVQPPILIIGDKGGNLLEQIKPLGNQVDECADDADGQRIARGGGPRDKFSRGASQIGKLPAPQRKAVKKSGHRQILAVTCCRITNSNARAFPENCVKCWRAVARSLWA